MLAYARSDTHFLLYIYDMLRLSLIERSSTEPTTTDETGPLTNTKHAHHACGLIRGVLTRSVRTALRLYETEVYDAESGTGSSGWDTLARKWNKVGLVASPAQERGTEVQGLQATVYKVVHRWREDVAREEDESIRFVFPDSSSPLLLTEGSFRYVLPTHYLFLLAERVPTTVPDLLSLFGGPRGVNGSVPPVLKRRTGELVGVIKGAVEGTKGASSPQRSAEDGRESVEIVVSTVVEDSEAMSSITPGSSAAKLTNVPPLWTVTPSSTSAATISTSRSSLFGIGILEERAQKKGATPPSSVHGEETYFAKESVLFGSALAEVSFVA